MQPMRNPYAVPYAEKDGCLVPPSEELHQQKLEAGCICPGCHVPLTVRRSKLNNLHFVHVAGKACSGGFETAVHRMAKQIIENEARLLLPTYTHTFREEVAGEEIKQTAKFSAKWTRLANIRQETRLDRWVPDVSATLPDGTSIYIEIFVTHAVEEAKSEAITNLVEIDLSKLSDDIIFDPDRFRDQVLAKASRHWYLCTLFDHDRKFQWAESQLREKVTGRKEWLHNKLAVRQQHARDLEHLEAASSGELIREHTEAVRSHPNVEQLNQWLHFVQQKTPTSPDNKSLEESVGSVAGVIGVDLAGSWIFNADKRVWQGYLIARFVTHPTQSTFTLDDAYTAVMARYGALVWMERLSTLKHAGLDYLETLSSEKKRHKGTPRLLYLEPEELPGIHSARSVIKDYLDYLSHHPANLLDRLGNAGHYQPRYESPESAGAVINQKMAARVSRARLHGHKMRAASLVVDTRKAQANDNETHALANAIGPQSAEASLALDRESRNEACIEKLQLAFDAGFRQVAYCSNCRHVTHFSNQAKPCASCRVGRYRYAPIGQRDATYHRRGFTMKPWHPE
ncbi:hypothetical protein [Vreelandella arcis]|uniref:Competence protein CoiA-like family protein n=1 Tax=Vreelandella arcis TaxID=416873 RepID=A0A1H0I9V5_9GAMM|nr:hypothetical protein [Halomonas arcis]SDO28182.1 hypothetical protein SAMN04487951_11915 [Halomonas arcis]